MEYNLENILTATMLKQILDLVYMEKVREDEGGTYGVQTSAQISSFPEGQTFLQAYFDTDPAKREKMNAIVRQNWITSSNPARATKISRRARTIS